MVYIMPSGMMPLPVGVSVAMRKRSNCFASRTRSASQSSGAQVAGGADLQRDLALVDDAREVRVGHRDRPAIDVERDVRAASCKQMVAQMPDEPGIDEPPVCTVVIMPCCLGPATIGT